MSYFVIAVKPERLIVNGVSKLIECGDVVHLSDVDTQSMQNSPYASSFVIVSYDDSEVSSSVSDSLIESIITPSGEDIYSTPNFNPVKEELPFYDENPEFFHQLTDNPFEDRLKSALPEGYNWKNLVTHVKSLGQLDPIPVDYVNFIQSKFSSLTSVVNECKRILTPEV